MWHAIFSLPIPVGEKVLRALLVYTFLIVAFRLAGKRELGQSNTLDLAVLLLVANAVQNGVIGLDNSVTGAVVGAATLMVANSLVSRAAKTSRAPTIPTIPAACGSASAAAIPVAEPALAILGSARLGSFDPAHVDRSDHQNHVASLAGSTPLRGCRTARRGLGGTSRGATCGRPRQQRASGAAVSGAGRRPQPAADRDRRRKP